MKEMKCLGFLLPLVFLSASAGHKCDRPCVESQPMTCEYDFRLEWYSTMSKACYNCPQNVTDCFRTDCIAADGIERDLTVVNRQLPGPPIIVCHNDNIVVRVHNALENNEGTVIHWHGIYQRGSQWMDGVPMVTQCPIPAGTSFTYKFVANPAGTHWWHSHAGFQRSDGIAGALIIKTPSTANPHFYLYDVDNENFTVFIGDWLHQPTMTKYLLHHHVDGSNKGEAILINGRGNVENKTKPPFAEFILEEGLRYRFRIISNAVVFCPIKLTFHGHIMTVIATDGSDVKPLNVTSLVVHGGERFDVVISANQQPGSYWMKAQGLADCANNSQKAIIRYSTAQEFVDVSPPLFQHLLNPLYKKESANTSYVTSLVSLNMDEKILGEPEQVVFLGFDFNKVNNFKYHDPDRYPIAAVPRNKRLYTPQINNVSWISPSSPLLTQPEDVDSSLLCNSHADSDATNKSDFHACSHVIDLPLKRLVELVVFDEGFMFNAGHPMHLHGQHFAVVAMDSRIGKNVHRYEIEALYKSNLIHRSSNLASSVKKDTVIVPDGGYVVLRFFTENPGIWLFHCHLSFHVEAGMTMAFRVGDANDVEGIPKFFPRCGNWPGFSTCSSMSNRCEDGQNNGLSIAFILFIIIQFCNIVMTF